MPDDDYPSMVPKALIRLLPRLKPRAVFVYLALADHANKQRTCFPSHRAIMETTGLQRRSVQLGLDELVANGLLRVEARLGDKGRTTSNLYLLAPQDPGALECAGGRTGVRRGGALECAGEGNPGAHSSAHLEESLNKNHMNTRRALRFDQADAATARWILGRIRRLNPDHRAPDLDRWANDVRLMREKDGRTDTEIRTLFELANADPFWQANILSPKKLREKFDQLTLKLRKQSHGRNGKYVGPGQRHPDDIRDDGTF